MEVRETLTVDSISKQCDQYLGNSLGYWPVQKVDTQLSLFIVLKLTPEILPAQYLYTLFNL
jgi:hypothetical protein